jgi:hypothetical protein
VRPRVSGVLTMDVKWAVVHIKGRGYAILQPGQLETIPAPFRERVAVVEQCDTEESAREAFARYPQEWTQGGAMHKDSRSGEWYESVGAVETPGGKVALFKPADRPLPVIELPQEVIDAMLPPATWCVNKTVE